MQRQAQDEECYSGGVSYAGYFYWGHFHFLLFGGGVCSSWCGGVKHLSRRSALCSVRLTSFQLQI